MPAIKPELLSGFRDMLPAEALARQKMISEIEEVYESFGFMPLKTPCMEKRDVLTGGSSDFNKSIFMARIVKGAEDKDVLEKEFEDDFALRFDLTVSLARVVAAYPELPRPFKRYQIGKVWRGERSQAGRFREFSQLDFDIIGSQTILADIEVLQIMYEVMKKLAIANFTIRFNSRKVLNGLAKIVGCGDKSKEMFRIIDKLDKIGLADVLSELQREPDNEWDESALAMSKQDSEKIARFLKIKEGNSENILKQLRSFFEENNDHNQEGLKELEEISLALKNLDIPEKNCRIDLSVARGLDYYTGPVFETTLDDLPNLGSVFSGGRFDGLTNRFMAGSNVAGVGASVGVDRLFVGLEKLGLIEQKDSLTEVLVTVFNEKTRQESLRIANEIRKEGHLVEVYLGEDWSLRAQFAYAAKRGIPFAIVVGPDEIENQTMQLKDMTSRQQETLTLVECLIKIRGGIR